MTKESEALATFLSACIDGEMNGDNMKKAMAEYVQPSVPAWQDAPNVPGLWVCQLNGQAYRWPNQYINASVSRWFGPIPEETK
jgi:hypothetical protein